jgi:hypothetical protein
MRSNDDCSIAVNFVSGISSGLGRSLLESCGFAQPLGRHTADLSMLENNTVIYCGINKDAESNDYVRDNFEFLHRIILSKPSHLIFISTIDVYQPVKTSYAHLKSSLEHFVNSHGVNSTILRLPMTLTNHSRRNHLVKMFDHEDITLSGEAKFNYISQNTIKKVLEEIIGNKILGTFDVTSKDTLSLNEIKAKFDLNCEFGNYFYITPEVFEHSHPNLLQFQKHSEEEIEEFFKL